MKLKTMLDNMVNSFFFMKKPEMNLDKVLNNCWASKNEVLKILGEEEYNKERTITLIVNFFDEDKDLRTVIEEHHSVREAMVTVERLKDEGYRITMSNYGLYEMHGIRKSIDIIQQHRLKLENAA